MEQAEGKEWPDVHSDSALPDNMLFCGFCGIELVTGERTTSDRWLGYLQTVMFVNSTRFTDVTTKMIGSAALVSGSIVTVVANIPFELIASQVLGILGTIGLIIGFSMLWMLSKANWELAVIQGIAEATYAGILTGTIKTSEEIARYYVEATTKMEGHLKLQRMISRPIINGISTQEETGQSGSQ